jgi:hypothetical protein
MSSTKWDEDDGRRVWRSIKPEGGVTIATLFGLAKNHGWRGSESPKLHVGGKAGQREKGGSPPEDDRWEDPDWSLLDDRRGELPDFPTGRLSIPWQQWVGKAARGAGVTPGHVMAPVLGAASSLIGGARRVMATRSWSEPCTLWTALVGLSGSGKTPGQAVTVRALALIEQSHKEKIEALKRVHQTRVETARAAGKKWKAEVEDAVKQGATPPEMPAEAAEPGQFIPPRLFVSDATVERLATLLQAKPRGLLLLADELAGLYLNMGRYNNGSDKEFWLQAWDGRPFTQERQSRWVSVPHLLIGVSGGFQPDKLARSFCGDDDGIYARVLFGWPSEPKFTGLSNDAAEVEPEFLRALTRLVDLVDTTGEEFDPRTVPLSPGAFETFLQFLQFLQGKKEELDGREREWWTKGGSQVLRLAGTLCYLNWSMQRSDSEPTEIDAVSMTAAVRLWTDYFWPHARASLRQVGLSEKHAKARRVLRWLRAKGLKDFSLMDIRREPLGKASTPSRPRHCWPTCQKPGG